MITALRGRIILRLDPEDRSLPAGLAAPDSHYHRICLICKRIDGALDSACAGDPIFEDDHRLRRTRFRGHDYSHRIRVVTAPTVVEEWRKATVVASSAPEFGGGDRVFVPASIGRAIPPGDPDSLIRETAADAVALTVEEE